MASIKGVLNQSRYALPPDVFCQMIHLMSDRHPLPTKMMNYDGTIGKSDVCREWFGDFFNIE